MNLYVLDTDHLSLHQRGHEPLCSRISSALPEEIFITAISVEEAIRGRFVQIKAAKKEGEFVWTYGLLTKTFSHLNQFHILDYDDSASRIFASLQQQRIRVGTRDLRIAAITLSVGGILVTRNAVDFGKVPGLTIQDWTV